MNSLPPRRRRVVGQPLNFRKMALGKCRWLLVNSSVMSTGSMPSGDSSGRLQPEAANDAVPAERSLLERVLQQTLAAQSDAPREVAELALLQAVARRHRGSPFSQEPVLVDLVGAILQAQFPAGAVGSAGAGGVEFNSAVVHVAEVLFHDPVSQARLQAFWNRLMDSLQ